MTWTPGSLRVFRNAAVADMTKIDAMTSVIPPENSPEWTTPNGFRMVPMNSFAAYARLVPVYPGGPIATLTNNADLYRFRRKDQLFMDRPVVHLFAMYFEQDLSPLALIAIDLTFSDAAALCTVSGLVLMLLNEVRTSEYYLEQQASLRALWSLVHES